MRGNEKCLRCCDDEVGEGGRRGESNEGKFMKVNLESGGMKSV